MPTRRPPAPSRPLPPLRPSLPHRPTLLQALSPQSLAHKALSMWSAEELQHELGVRGLRTEGSATSLMLRLQAASFREW